MIISKIWNFEFTNKEKNLIEPSTCNGMELTVKVENEDTLIESKDIVNPIDLPKIKEKADSYTSLDEFVADIEWFVHNCEVLFEGDFYFDQFFYSNTFNNSFKFSNVKKMNVNPLGFL